MATKKKTKKKASKPSQKLATSALATTQQLELSGTGSHLVALGYITDPQGAVVSQQVRVRKTAPFQLALPPAAYVYVFNLNGSGAASIQKTPGGTPRAVTAPAVNRSYSFRVT